jgi:hypothetical protein
VELPKGRQSEIFRFPSQIPQPRAADLCCSVCTLNESRYNRTFRASFSKFFGNSRHCRLSPTCLSNVAPHIRLSPEVAGDFRQSCSTFDNRTRLSMITLDFRRSTRLSTFRSQPSIFKNNNQIFISQLPDPRKRPSTYGRRSSILESDHSCSTTDLQFEKCDRKKVRNKI